VIISVNSLLMMLYWAIGKGGVLSDPVLFNLVCFYSYDLKIAPPALIKSEIERAKRMGLIDVNEMNTQVTFTEKGFDAVKENDISMDSFMNPKMRSIREMEKRMSKMSDKLLAQQIQIKVDKTRMAMSGEHLLWRGPPEWGLGWGVAQPAATEAKKEIAVGDDLKITKAPPKPKKLG